MEQANNTIPLFSLDGHKCLCKIVSVYDADTCSGVLNLNGKLCKFKFRLNGIDSPEMKPPKAQPNRETIKQKAKCARNRLVQLVTDQELDCDKQYKKKEIQDIVDKSKKLVYVECGEFDKYGRLLVNLYPSETEKTLSFNQTLVQEGHAYEYDGGTKKEWV